MKRMQLTAYSMRHGRSQARSHIQANNGKKGQREISFGSISALLVAIAPLLGYFLAFAWRSGEAAFYGIPDNLISVSIEDALCYAIPLILLFVSLGVVFFADGGERKGRDKAFIASNSVQVAFYFVAVFICATMISQPTDEKNVAFQCIMIVLLIPSFIRFVIAVLKYVLIESISVGYVLGLVIGLVLFIHLNSVAMTLVIIVIAATAMLIFMAIREERFSMKMRFYKRKRSSPLTVVSTGLFITAFLVAVSFWCGYNSATYRDHLVLVEDQSQVVLTTYGGDRSIIGTVDDKGFLLGYNAVNLTDSELKWTAETVAIQGYGLFR